MGVHDPDLGQVAVVVLVRDPPTVGRHRGVDVDAAGLRPGEPEEASSARQQ
jgi:hypothetical protein